MSDTKTFTLPAGTVCKRNGIPFTLQHATQVECCTDDWTLIQGEPPEAAGECVPHKPRAPDQQALVDSRERAQQVERMYVALQALDFRLPATTRSREQLLKAAGYSIAEIGGPEAPSPWSLARLGVFLKQLGARILTKGRK